MVLTSGRRLVVLVVLGALWAGAGSAVFAPPAFAGGVDNTTGYLSGALYNLTPYTWTKVAQASPAVCWYSNLAGQYVYGLTNCWATPFPPQPEPAATIAPGGASPFTLAPNLLNFSSFGPAAGGEAGYDAWVTYRVDVLGGAPEYLTFTVSQAYRHGTFGSADPALVVWNTTAPPPASYDPGPNSNAPPATQTVNPQITYSHNAPQQYDQTFQIAGHYTVDASTNLGAPFVNVLNALCSKAANTSCSFTQTGPLMWRLGDPYKSGQSLNCTVIPPGTGGAPSGRSVGEGPPPASDPNWFEVEYNAVQSATVSVGGGVAGSVEFDLFGTIASEATLKVEAEHEWSETKTFIRKAKVFIPSNNIAAVWVAPEVGVITGTLTISSGSATFTATNFSEQRSGVTKDDLTPAFDVITKIRPMTDSEYRANCVHPSSLVTRGRKASKGDSLTQARRALARVRLGQTQVQVISELGQPSLQRFTTKTCRARDLRCDELGGRGGTWVYQGLAVVFGTNHRVSAVIESVGGRTRMVLP
ncbi:MAG: hypothetical protein JO181_15425 [Solirubrobacterales bacterium]|nr:hypothetical protein [Solirubrobacterales bacterium]